MENTHQQYDIDCWPRTPSKCSWRDVLHEGGGFRFVQWRLADDSRLPGSAFLDRLTAPYSDPIAIKSLIDIQRTLRISKLPSMARVRLTPGLPFFAHP
jgi:hypothetical protein